MVVPDRLGRAVFVMHFNRFDSSTTFDCYQKMAMYLMEQITDHEQVQERGIFLVFDCRDAESKAFRSATMTDAQRGSQMWDRAYPVRINQVYVLGLSSPTIAIIQAIMLVSVSSRMRSLVNFCDLGTAVSALGAEFLPPSLGGTLGSGPAVATESSEHEPGDLSRGGPDPWSWERVVENHLSCGTSLLRIQLESKTT